jgi:hypothetical protein
MMPWALPGTLQAFHSGRFDRARQFITDGSRGDLEFLEEIYSGWRGPGIDITGIGFNDSGDQAVVTFNEAGREGEQELTLMRVNGHWKVALGKSNK